MTAEDFKRKLTAILSADVVGYSRLMGDDEAATVKTLETYKGVMSSLIKQHRGRVVDSPGDNLLAEFGSVVDAVQCAVSIQKELQTRNASLPENRRMDFRIGINLGDVIEEEDRIYGDGVNIAARLEALADPGGICISKTAFDYIENKLPFGYSFIGEQTVKNIAKPIGAYKVLMETRLIDEEVPKTSVSFWNRKAVLSLGIIVILALATVLYWKFYLSEPSVDPASIVATQETVVPDVKESPKTIAVLPFDDISPNKDQGYFVDGLTEEISTALEQIPNLSVIARASSFSFKNSNKTIQEIGAALGADHILRGSIRKAENTLRITARLIKAANDSTLWSKKYDIEYNVKEILVIQEDIASSVADNLKLTLDAFQLLGGTNNINAYEKYLSATWQGQQKEKRYITGMNDIEYWRFRINLLESVIVLDPEFALAYAEKAMAHIQLANMLSYDLINSELDAAIQAAEKSIKLEPNLAIPYIAIQTINMIKGNWIEAEVNCRKAIKLLNGNITDDENWLSGFYISVGKFNKAQEILDQIRKNDPLAKGYYGFIMINSALLGNIEGAEKAYEVVKNEVEPVWYDWCITLVRIGTKNILSKDKIVVSNQIYDLGKESLDAPTEGLIKLRELYNDGSNVNVTNLVGFATWATYFGDSEFAMEILERAAKVANIPTTYLWLPVYKKVRQLPRFKEYVREIGLVDYWKKYGWPDSNICRPIGDDDFEFD